MSEATECCILAVAALGLVVAAACRPGGEERQDGAGSESEAAVAMAEAPIVLSEIAAEAGLDFVHRNGATGRFFYPELMQGGAGLVDVDGDGDLDAYLVQSGELPPDGGVEAENRLYLNQGDGHFIEATEASGLGDRGYGSGVAAADYDGDGRLDLYVTNLGRNSLYRGLGDGRFEDVTRKAGVGDPGYSTCAAFFDYDADGDLDLYVCNYLVWSPEREKQCLGPMGLQGYCGPGEYEPQRDTLYRNRGDGSFEDVTAASGIGSVASTGLGIAVADFDGDGRVDVYVANDQRANFLWINAGDGTFHEEALERGCALNELGQPEAGMGVAIGDPDADGDWDLFLTHLSGETNTYYRNEGDGNFVDVTDELGLGALSRPYTGFGTGFADLDHDGVVDLFVANGKVSPGDDVRYDYREPNQVLAGEDDGSYRDVSSGAGPALALLEVSRAVAFGDVDGDGDVDLLMSNNEGPVRLYRNDSPKRGHWVRLALGEIGSARTLGAVVTISANGRIQRRLAHTTSSYCSSNDPAVHFGLGDAGRVERVEVDWGDGRHDRWADLAADRSWRLAPGAAPAAAP